MNLPKLKAEIVRYSKSNGYEASEFHSIACECGHTEFRVFSDDNEGGCCAVCADCNRRVSVCDSADYIEDVVQNICRCGHEELKLMTGAALYPDSTDISWVYVGASCPKCGLAGVYVDWKER